ncbi:MAG: nickel-binding protein [Dehalococcoidia bacterium]
MDVHRNAQGLTREQLEQAHIGDLQFQEKYGVRYITYWWNADAGNVYCLVEAPSQEAATAVHSEAHGLVADTFIEVEPITVNAMMHLRQEDLPNGQTAPDTGEIDSGLRAIMFTDLAGSTAMLNALGDDAALRHVAAHNKILASCLDDHGGRRIKATGDGILATFSSVSRAVACTVAIQRAFAAHNATNIGPPLDVRIGLSAGEPVQDSDDLFGVAVNLAARVCDYADGGSIFTVNVVRELSIGKGHTFVDRGDTMFKGFADPVRVYEVAWRD